MEVPRTRFPGYFHEGSTNREAPEFASVLGWGEHGGVLESSRDPNKGSFIPLYSRKWEKWTPEESVPSALLPPNNDCDFGPVTESDLLYKKAKSTRGTKWNAAEVNLAFSRQVGQFCWDYNRIAFQCMGRLLEPQCHLGDHLLKGKRRKDCQQMTSLMHSLQDVPYQDCPFPYATFPMRSFSYLTCDWLQDVPPALLAELVNEGMAEDWRKLQFQASLSGGALSWTSYPGTSCGCLIYPRGAAMNRLHFQQLLLDQTNGLEVKLQGDPAVFELTEPIQQVSAGYHEQISVGVRSSFHLASWSFSHHDPPRALSVLRTRTPSTCITASPHIAAEFSVCTEGGALHLWSLETGLQSVRQEADTLCFRDDPYWRWSDFTSHPRVLILADRTGVQFADMRVPNSQSRDLFHIGQESSCRRGERVILPRCLRETNPVYCLVSTQFSLYIMDERFPLVPVAKWDHMLEGPPTYVSVVPGGATDSSSKILLSTQHSQETLMVQYSSGHSGSCQLHLPAVCLPQISESLNHLTPLLPHHHDTVLRRLQSPLAGMAAASPQSAAHRLLVFQLTASGDLFYHRLSQKTAARSGSGIRVESTVSSAIPEEPSAEHPHQSMSAGCDQQGASSDRPSCLLVSNTGFCSWLHDLYTACTWKAPISRPPWPISTLFPSSKISYSSQEAAKLRQRLRDSMKWGALVPSLAAAPSQQLETIQPNGWKDPLSQRLTACWEGRLGLWWDDRLGRNKESKIQALREKRQRQKQLRSRSLSSLSRSFTTSITSVEARSVWSYDSAPDGLASLPSTSQDCAADASQPTVTSRLAHLSCAITSSQALQAKGIPCERRQTLRHFLSFVEDCTSAGPALSFPGSPPLSQRSQPPNKKSRMGF